MTINFTLFVQIINFYIAYKILIYLFLKPILEVIKEEENKQKELVDEVTFQSEKLALKKIDKQERWRECQREFDKIKPTIKEFNIRKIDSREISKFDTSSRDIKNKLISNLISALKEKVKE